MLSQVCLYLKNWFDEGQPHYYGKFTIKDGVLTSNKDGDILVDNQYYWIDGSVFNNGVYKHNHEQLIDEIFDGSVVLMAVPKDVLDLVTEIEAWQAAYGGVSSQSMSPYNSESFAGYSYSKSVGGGTTGSAVVTWQSVYADRLGRYKKTRGSMYESNRRTN